MDGVWSSMWDLLSSCSFFGIQDKRWFLGMNIPGTLHYIYVEFHPPVGVLILLVFFLKEISWVLQAVESSKIG